MGTDYPFDMGDRDPVKTVASLPHLSDDQKEMIFGANAAALFKISDLVDMLRLGTEYPPRSGPTPMLIQT
jgi:hypothetical protein